MSIVIMIIAILINLINYKVRDDQWLGVAVSSQGPGGKAIVCAHRYTRYIIISRMVMVMIIITILMINLMMIVAIRHSLVHSSFIHSSFIWINIFLLV